jgi:hypothetical protein
MKHFPNAAVTTTPLLLSVLLLKVNTVGKEIYANGTVVVLQADSPGKAAQWFAESIPES